MSWSEIQIKDIGKVITGNTPPKNDSENYGGIYPFLKPTDMNIGERYTFLTDESYSEKAFDRYKNSYIPPLSTCVVTIGTIGEKMCLTHDWCFTNQSVNSVIPNFDKYDGMFIFYLLKYNLYQVKYANAGTSSGREHVNKTTFSNIKVSVPKSIETQKRIACILSNYDDLIENNLKRIKLLEETAQNIYKEWFVNFRFPNYEHTEFDAESGLPVGWKKKSLNNFDCVCQFKEKVKPYIGEKEYLATANVEGINISERGEYFTFENRPSRAQHLAPQESVWFARMSKTYKVLLFTKSTNSDILLSSGFVGFIPKKSQFLPFLFCLINNKLFFDTKDMFCTGSTQVSLNNESINKLIYVEPNEEIITEFGNKVYPLIEQINKLFELNQKLKEARDILLPRLMNRTIEV